MAQSGSDSALAARVDEAVGRAVEEGQAPGVVAAVARRDSVHIAAAGSLAVGGPPVRPDSVFRISSMTKPITAACVLSLVEDGLLELDGTVERWLPELANRRVLVRPDGPLAETVPADRPITARDLLTFTWGLGMQGAMFLSPQPWPITATAEAIHAFGPPAPAEIAEPDRFMAQLAELPLAAQPGERWLYSTGSLVLGVLAGRAGGGPFDEVLQERVLGPLGMGDTAFWARDISRLATAYETGAPSFTVWDPPEGQWSSPPAFADGAAGLVSTAGDMVAFGRMLLAGGAPVLRGGTVEEMSRNHLTPAQRANVWPGFDLLDGQGWGYGLAVRDDGQYGWDGGLGTTWANLPAQDATVVVLTQRLGGQGMAPVCTEVVGIARESGLR